MTKHTPGPWFIEGKNIRIGDDQESIECPGSGGAMSFTGTVCTIHWEGTPEWTANARLIAAAPELLQALYLCFGAIDRCPDDSLSWHFAEAHEAAKIAIAKATGE